MPSTIDPELQLTKSQAIEYISHERFHRRFELPATGNHDALTVSYADVGLGPERPGTASQVPTILLMPGMFASRYLSVAPRTLLRRQWASVFWWSTGEDYVLEPQSTRLSHSRLLCKRPSYSCELTLTG